jgi:hypothetical protein
MGETPVVAAGIVMTIRQTVGKALTSSREVTNTRIRMWWQVRMSQRTLWTMNHESSQTIAKTMTFFVMLWRSSCLNRTSQRVKDGLELGLDNPFTRVLIAAVQEWETAICLENYPRHLPHYQTCLQRKKTSAHVTIGSHIFLTELTQVGLLSPFRSSLAAIYR